MESGDYSQPPRQRLEHMGRESAVSQSFNQRATWTAVPLMQRVPGMESGERASVMTHTLQACDVTECLPPDCNLNSNYSSTASTQCDSGRSCCVEGLLLTGTGAYCMFPHPCCPHSRLHMSVPRVLCVSYIEFL